MQKFLWIFLLVFFCCKSLAMANDNNAFSTEVICRAAISSIMGRDVSIIKANTVGKEVRLSYVREDDQTIWKTKCYLNENKIIWASETGRWRTNPLDEVITYKVKDNKLYINETYTDGSFNEKTFELKDF